MNLRQRIRRAYLKDGFHRFPRCQFGGSIHLHHGVLRPNAYFVLQNKIASVMNSVGRQRTCIRKVRTCS